MERRLEIYNKIKNTKISKLTLKQNGEAKTLNLKVDLLNESVFLSDKALDMLENLANKQILSTEKIKPKQIETPQPLPQAINEQETIAAAAAAATNYETPISSQFFEENNEFPSFSQLELKPDNPMIRLEQVEELLERVEEEPPPPPSVILFQPNNPITNTDYSFLCRICLTKCPHERALHDHVTRIHGGSDYRRKHCQFLNNNNSSLLYDDTNSDTNDDLNSSINSNTPVNNSKLMNKKFKLLHEKQKKHKQQAKKLFLSTNSPKPNVAIRVAKVAYYNNKNSLNASNNSSKIFVNGIRGNFFSQERLPLKSCKIKIGIDDTEQKNTLKFSANEINKFFRSLLAYIPNEILSLEDLIQQNRSLNESKTVLLNRVHSLVLEAKECGITLYELKTKSSIESMNTIMEILNILLKDFLILSVGVCERVYVAHEHCQSWIILSYKNQKGCNYSSSTADTPATQSSSYETNSELLLKQKQYKKVWLIPRPWRYIDGLLNRQMLEKVFESIVLFLKVNPRVTLENISSHYSPVLQPIMTLELLEMLEHLNCVKSIRLKKESLCNLESSFDHDSNYVLNDDDLIGNEISLYDCNSDSIFILKQIFSN